MRQLLNIRSSGAMTFDGLDAVVWVVSMRSPVNMPPRTKNISPGVLYTFIIRQDATGHTFTWPATCHNAAPVDTSPNTVTIQNFIGSTGGELYPDVTGVWR